MRTCLPDSPGIRLERRVGVRLKDIECLTESFDLGLVSNVFSLKNFQQRKTAIKAAFDKKKEKGHLQSEGSVFSDKHWDL